MQILSDYERNNNLYECIEIAKNVFNYFNGKINPTIPAALDFFYDPRDCTIGVTTLNYIQFNLAGLHLDDMYYNKRTIVVAIIHELLHVEQSIDILRLNLDTNYKLQIETDVEYLTMQLVGYYVNTIYNMFGIIINLSEIDMGLSIYGGYYQDTLMFSRKSIEDYYVYLMQVISIGNLFNHTKQVTSAIYNSDIQNIILNFNGKTNQIKTNGILNPNLLDNIQIIKYFIEVECRISNYHIDSGIDYDTNTAYINITNIEFSQNVDWNVQPLSVSNYFNFDNYGKQRLNNLQDWRK